MNIGDTVRLEVKNDLYNVRNRYASGVVRESSIYEGTILARPAHIDDSYICLSTDIAEFAYRVIAKANILRQLTAKVIPAEQQTVWQISVKNSVYIVNRMGSRWACNCTGYRYRKSCSHVLTAKTEYQNKYGQDQNTALLLEQAGVESNGKLNLKHKPKGRYIMVKSVNTTKSNKTQAGVALALYQKNKNITCAEFVTGMQAEFPAIDAHNAALYWQKKSRRAQFGLPAVTIPAEFRPNGKTSTPRVKKEKVAKAKTSVDALVNNIAAIKAKNLETMRAVTARNKKAEKSIKSDGLSNKDYEGTSFAAPASISKSDLKAMI